MTPCLAEGLVSWQPMSRPTQIKGSAYAIELSKGNHSKQCLKISSGVAVHYTQLSCLTTKELHSKGYHRNRAWDEQAGMM